MSICVTKNSQEAGGIGPPHQKKKTWQKALFLYLVLLIFTLHIIALLQKGSDPISAGAHQAIKAALMGE